MTTRATILLSPVSLERLECDIAVAGFYSDERPLRGGAARADWRLCGQISQRIERGDLDGACGEALLMSASQALHAPRLMVLGLGLRSEFDTKRLCHQTEDAVRRCLQLKCLRLALTPFGIAPDDVPRHAAALLTGIRAAVEEASSAVRIELSIRRSEIPAVEQAFREAIRSLGAKEIEFEAPRIEASREPARRAAAAPISRSGP